MITQQKQKKKTFKRRIGSKLRRRTRVEAEPEDEEAPPPSKLEEEEKKEPYTFRFLPVEYFQDYEVNKMDYMLAGHDAKENDIADWLDEEPTEDKKHKK